MSTRPSIFKFIGYAAFPWLCMAFWNAGLHIVSAMNIAGGCECEPAVLDWRATQVWMATGLIVVVLAFIWRLYPAES